MATDDIMTMIRSVLLLCAISAFILTKSYLRRRWKREQARLRGCLPAPTVPSKGLFGVSTLRESLRATKEERGVQWIAAEMDKIGDHVHTVRADIFDYELIVTRDVENVKALLASQSADFDIGPHREKTFKSIFGLGVMTARGQKWKHSRALIRPQFSRDQIMNLDLFESHVQNLIDKLVVGDAEWTDHVDLSPLFYHLTLDVSTEFLVGQSVHSLNPELQAEILTDDPDAPSLAEFGASLDRAKVILDRRGALAKYGWLIRSKEFDNACKIVRGFVSYFVDRTLKRQAAGKSDVANGRIVLLHELAELTQNRITLQNEILNVLHAARDTTAALLGWIFYFLARHPDIFQKVRHEILEHFPGAAKEDMTFRKIWDSQYLVCVVNETIRYVGIVPMNERAAVVDTTLPRGGGPDGNSPIFVAKGTQVLIPAYAMQHRKDIWGADVEEFKPERWEHRKFSWEFVPFGGGARQCIGQQFARTQAMYTVIRFLQTFDRIENMEPPGQPIRFHHSIENRSGTGVQVRLHAAQRTIRRRRLSCKRK